MIHFLQVLFDVVIWSSADRLIERLITINYVFLSIDNSDVRSLPALTHTHIMIKYTFHDAYSDLCRLKRRVHENIKLSSSLVHGIIGGTRVSLWTDFGWHWRAVGLTRSRHIPSVVARWSLQVIGLRVDSDWLLLCSSHRSRNVAHWSHNGNRPLTQFHCSCAQLCHRIDEKPLSNTFITTSKTCP